MRSKHLLSLVVAAFLLPLLSGPTLAASICGAPESWETPTAFLQCLASARPQVSAALPLPLTTPAPAEAGEQAGKNDVRQSVTYLVNNDPAPLRSLLGRQLVFLGYAVVSSYTIASNEQLLQADASGAPVLGGLNEMGLPTQTRAVMIEGVAASRQPGYLTSSAGAFQDSRVDYLYWTQNDGSLGGLAIQYVGNTELMSYSVFAGVDMGAAAAH